MLYLQSKHAKSSKYSIHLQKVFNICHFMRLQCKFTMCFKEFPQPQKKKKKPSFFLQSVKFGGCLF